MATSIAFDIYAKDRASKTFDQVGRSADKASSHVSKMGSTLGSFAKVGLFAAGGAFVAGAGALVGLGVKTAAANEQAQISFTSLLGSASKSQKFLKGLTSFAASTPFDLPGVEKAAQQLLGVGVQAKGVIPFLTAFGNTSSAVGMSTEQFNSAMQQTTQAIANGKFQIGDLSALASNGIPIYKLLSEAMHQPTKAIMAMATAGKLTSDKVLPLLQKQMNKDYGGAMIKQSQSLTGLWSTFQDTLSQGMAQVIGPLIPMLKTGLGGAISGLSALTPKLAAGLQAVFGWIANTAVPAVGRLIGMFKGFGHEGPSALARFSGPVSKVKTSFQEMIAAVKPIVADVVTTIRAHWGPITTWARKNFGQVKDIIAGMLKLIAAIWRREAQVISFIWKHWGKDIMAVVTRIFAAIGPAVSGGLRAVRGIIKVITSLINGDWSGAWHGVKMIFSGVMQSIGAAAKLAMAGLKAVFMAGLHAVVALVKKLPGWIMSGLGNLGSLLVNAGKQVIQGLINGIESMVGSLTSKLHSITSLIPLHKGPISKDRVLLQPAGVAIMKGLVDGLTKGEPLLKTALGKITGYISAMGSKLSDLLSQRQSVVDSFRGFTTSVFGTDLSTQNDDGSTTPATVASMLAYQQAQAAKAAQTRSDVARLIRAGLSKSLIAQMQQSGESGMAQLHTLAGATPAQIRALNQADAATNSNLSAAGMAAGNALFAGQIDDTARDLKFAKTIARELGHVLHQHAKDGEIHIHLEGQTIVETIRKHQRKQGKKPTV